MLRHVRLFVTPQTVTHQALLSIGFPRQEHWNVLPPLSPRDLAVTIHNAFRAQEEEICHCFHLFPFYLPCSNGAGCHKIMLLICSFKPALSLASFTLIKRLFNSSSLSAIRVVSSAYLRLLMFLPPILIPACNSSSLAFLMMCSAYRLYKQHDSRQPCRTPFSIFSQKLVPYRVLTVAS